MGFEPLIWSWSPLDLEADALPVEPPRPPLFSLKADNGAQADVTEIESVTFST